MKPLGLRVAPLVLLAACNMTTFTADQTAPVLKAAVPAFNQESDPQLAREAAPGQLKTVEGFLMASPKNEIFLKLLAQGYCEYAFGFLESDAEDARFAKQQAKSDELARRASGLYFRCMNYGLRLLGNGWDKALFGTNDAFARKLKSAVKDDVPGLFWTGLGLGSAINLNRDDIEIVAYLPRVEMIFQRTVELDETFYNAGGHMVLGMLWTAAPRAMGGDPEKGLKEFQRCIQMTQGKYLMPQVLLAISYGTIMQDRKFFHELLVKVLQTSPAIWPEERLANELAHIKARRYLAHEKELF
jgi:TRAP transporter TatT component family protein